MGGEKLHLLLCVNRRYGSPPRGRGKGAPAQSSWAAAGITPAWAGKRGPAGARPWAAQDHPRVGGEKYYTWLVKASVEGSPPRGRGKVLPNGLSSSVPWITPAWAGKRLQFFGLSAARGDHPRVGGEKALADLEVST